MRHVNHRYKMQASILSICYFIGLFAPFEQALSSETATRNARIQVDVHARLETYYESRESLRDKLPSTLPKNSGDRIEAYDPASHPPSESESIIVAAVSHTTNPHAGARVSSPATPPAKPPSARDTEPPSRLGNRPYAELIEKYAAEYDLDPALVAAVIQIESANNPQAVSRAGAAGLMQLMPGTARDLGVTNRFDPEQNIAGGSRYLRQMLDRFDDDLELALAAYNAGPAKVSGHGGVPPYNETRRYIVQVTEEHARLTTP